jgi:hypothetical protein
MHELHRNMPHVGPRRRCITKRNEPPTTRKSFGHPMTKPRNTISFSGKKRYGNVGAKV